MKNTQKWMLLDFDNCQMATEHLALPSLIERFNKIYGDEISYPLTLEEFKAHFHGQARESLCANLSTHFGIKVDYPLLYEAREMSVISYYKQTGVQMAPNLVEALTKLESEGYKFAFVSNNSVQRGLAAMRYATNGQGEQLAKFFGTAFFEAGDVQKPKPDVYLKAMELLDTIPTNCFAVEDSLTGMKSAVSAGIRTFGYLGFTDYPKETALKLTEAGAIRCFDNWQELPSILEKYDMESLGDITSLNDFS